MCSLTATSSCKTVSGGCTNIAPSFSDQPESAGWSIFPGPECSGPGVAEPASSGRATFQNRCIARLPRARQRRPNERVEAYRPRQRPAPRHLQHAARTCAFAYALPKRSRNARTRGIIEHICDDRKAIVLKAVCIHRGFCSRASRQITLLPPAPASHAAAHCTQPPGARAWRPRSRCG